MHLVRKSITHSISERVTVFYNYKRIKLHYFYGTPGISLY